MRTREGTAQSSGPQSRGCASVDFAGTDRPPADGPTLESDAADLRQISRPPCAGPSCRRKGCCHPCEALRGATPLCRGPRGSDHVLRLQGHRGSLLDLRGRQSDPWGKGAASFPGCRVSHPQWPMPRGGVGQGPAFIRERLVRALRTRARKERSPETPNPGTCRNIVNGLLCLRCWLRSGEGLK